MREVNINGERSMREVYIDDKQPVTQGEIDDHPVVESDEDMFAFGIFELNTKGKHCTCPTVNALGHKNNYDNYNEFIDEFDAEADAKVDARGSDSDTTDVAKETENMMTFSSVSGGLMTETAARRIIQRLTRFDPTVEPSEHRKDAAKQACTIAKELGWDGVIPDEDDRHWYELN